MIRTSEAFGIIPESHGIPWNPQVMIFNVVTLTLILAACLAHTMWLVFPRARTDGMGFDVDHMIPLQYLWMVAKSCSS